MRKYISGLYMLILAVFICAFSRPAKSSRVNYYLFEYQAPTGSYAKIDVENEHPTYWGYGTLITSVCDFTGGCPQMDTLEKACEIIVTEPETVLLADGRRRLRRIDDGPTNAIIINAKTLNLHPNTYMVDAVNSPTIDCVENKQY